MLSNTAVPKYYGKFRQDVLDGKKPVCDEISMQMNRIDALIANPAIYYDDEAVEGYIRFTESELTLTDGSDFKMLDSFKLWAEDVFGWYYFVERSIFVPNQNGTGGHYVTKKVLTRLTKKQYLIVGRGAAKTLYDLSIHNYWLVAVPVTTHQITTAPTMVQADEVLSPYRTALAREKGPVFKFMRSAALKDAKTGKLLLESTKKGIENKVTNSLLEIRPMSIEKLQGLRCWVATIDEWLSVEIREDPIGAIEQGASKNPDYLIVATSSEGTVRNGVGDSMKMELKKILKGEYYAPHVSIWWYKQDSVEEVGKPEMWLKSNPNIGKTVTYETIQLDVERAEHSTSARNDILAKRFGLPMEGYTYFFTYEETLPHRPRSYWNMRCAMGADLSLGDDFCSFSFLFPLGTYNEMLFGIKTINYITEYTLLSLPVAMREKYNEFINEGSLIIMPGTVLDMIAVYEHVDNYIQSQGYDVCCFGYDPYNAKDFVERWERENGPYGIEKVIQGAKTESVPLGELKKLAHERALLFDQQLMTFAMGNAVAIVDNNGNKKLMKNRNDQKIDAVASTMDAYIAYKLNREMFE